MTCIVHKRWCFCFLYLTLHFSQDESSVFTFLSTLVYQWPPHTSLLKSVEIENLHKGKQGKVVPLSPTTPLSKTYVHPLCALHSSHQIKFLLCSALVLYLQNVLLEQHKHVTLRTLRGFTQTETSFLLQSFAFLLLPLMLVLGLIKRLSYLLVCFSPMKAFPGKQATTHV